MIANPRETIAAMRADPEFQELRSRLIAFMSKYKYSQNFSWYGRPAIQIPDDLVTLQEIILRTQPEVIVEAGVAHGGSLVFLASMLELLGRGLAIGVEIELRPQNRAALAAHPLRHRFTVVEGSSTSADVVRRVAQSVGTSKKVMVILDSNHTHQHVLDELRCYQGFVQEGMYLVVMDTVVEEMPDEYCADRPWGKGNNPQTAVDAFLKENDRFAVDAEIEQRLIISVAPGGILRCVRNSGAASG